LISFLSFVLCVVCTPGFPVRIEISTKLRTYRIPRFTSDTPNTASLITLIILRSRPWLETRAQSATPTRKLHPAVYATWPDLFLHLRLKPLTTLHGQLLSSSHSGPQMATRPNCKNSASTSTTSSGGPSTSNLWRSTCAPRGRSLAKRD
jgi:hypothetical protein